MKCSNPQELKRDFDGCINFMKLIFVANLNDQCQGFCEEYYRLLQSINVIVVNPFNFVYTSHTNHAVRGRLIGL